MLNDAGAPNGFAASVEVPDDEPNADGDPPRGAIVALFDDEAPPKGLVVDAGVPPNGVTAGGVPNDEPKGEDTGVAVLPPNGEAAGLAAF